MRLRARMDLAVAVAVISSCSAKVGHFDAAYIVDRVGLEPRKKYYEHTHACIACGERGKMWEAHVA